MRTKPFLLLVVAAGGLAGPAGAQSEEAPAGAPVEGAPAAGAPVEPAPRPEPSRLKSSAPAEVDAELRERQKDGRNYEGFRLQGSDGQALDYYRAYGGGAGLRLSLTDVSGGLGSDRAIGLTLGWAAGSATVNEWGMTSLTRTFGYIGGGSGGFEGGLGGGFYGGWRAPFGKTHGPVGRVGMFGMLAGNNVIYDSRLTLPQGQLGYQVFTGDLFFEAGFQPGAVLTGRFDPLDGAARKLNSTFDLGFYASAWSSWLRLDLEARRFVGREREGQGNYDQVHGSFCALFGLGAVCLDGRHDRGDVPRGDGSYALVRSTYVGALIGFSIHD
jgi:hypothetical protein